MKAELEVDGQHQTPLDRDTICVRKSAIPGCVEAVRPKHRRYTEIMAHNFFIEVSGHRKM